jgi:two-component system, cell cycle sensor histidine kinase and response regulator CckA
MKAPQMLDLLRAVAENTTDAIFVKDLNGKYLFVNQATATIVGKPQDFLVGKDDTHLFDHESAMRLIASDRQTMKMGVMVTVEEQLTSNGVMRTYLVTKGPYRNEQGDIIGMVGISRDISERKAAERSLRLTQFSIDRSVDSMFWISPSGEILYANDAACHTLGYDREELVGSTVTDIDPDFTPDAWRAHWDEVKRRGSFTIQTVHVTKDGRLLQTETTVNYLRFDGLEYNCAVMRDMTEQRLLEEQLRQSQKMEAVGQLAGGVAHDFNNLLTVINLHCELLLANPVPRPSFRDSIIEIRDAGTRAAQLTAQLLAFSRRSTVELRTVQLNDIVAGVETMLRRLLGAHVELSVQLATDLGLIKADVNQLEQVLINLAVNARDAMTDGGTIRIQTSLVSSEQLIQCEPSGIHSENYAQLTFTDNGSGMNEEVLSRVFEPFFTTKEVGKGSGLGLAVVYGIVQQNGGFIRAMSRAGRGTTFTIQFPISSTIPAPQEPEINERLHKGSGTVLLVEDEPAVRKITRFALEHQGYRVLDAGDGKDALQLVKGLDSPIDLLITDVVMPGISGTQLAVSLRQQFPHLPVMFMSGYHENEQLGDASLSEDVTFLGKPFTLQEFVSKVNHYIELKRQRNDGGRIV